MEKFARMRLAAEENLRKELERIDAIRTAEIKKLVNPLVSKFSALMAEETEKVAMENLDALESYRFRKPEVRAIIRALVISEISRCGVSDPTNPSQASKGDIVIDSGIPLDESQP